MALRKRRVKEELKQVTVLAWRDRNGNYYLRHMDYRNGRKGGESFGRVLVREACSQFFLVTGIRLNPGEHRYYKFTPTRSARRLPTGYAPSYQVY